MRRVNVFSAQPEYDETDPRGYAAAVANLGHELGSQELSLKLFEIPPGQSLCPYHYEYVEEWLLVLAGTGTLRLPEGEQQVEEGDLVLFSAGPQGAHKVTNRGQEKLRIVMFSSSREPAVAVYPDSDKVGVWSGNDEDKWMFRGGQSHLEYYDGEV